MGRIMGRIIAAPVKSITASVGGGIGLGVGGSTRIGGVGVSAEASIKDADILVIDSEGADLINQSSMGMEIEMGIDNTPFKVSASSIVGEQHSYCDEDCTCDFWTDTFAEKIECEANEEIVENTELTVGVGASLYLGIGFEFDISMDLNALQEEYVDIWNDAMSYE